MTLLALEGVEDGLRLLLEVGGLLRVVTEDESTGDETDQDGDEVSDHGFGMTVTLTRGPRSAGVTGSANSTT